MNKAPTPGWQSWSSPYPKWHGFPLWDYSPFTPRELPKRLKNKNPLNIKYWCSWYAYGWDILDEKINQTLEVIKKHKLRFTHVIIDDGWTTWGDWHTPDLTKFPNFKKTIKKIKSHNLKVGLWVAPFLASKKSTLFKDHPDWFIKHKGRPVQGLKIFPVLDWFLPHEYLLNFELKPVRKYTTDFIDKAITEWKIDLLKLDFLYAPYFNPNHKSDIIPHKQLRWIFSYIHTKYPHVITIASGTPFAPVIDLASVVRVSQDTALPPYLPNFLSKIVYRTRVKILSVKLKMLQVIKAHNLDPDIRLFQYDDLSTDMLWEKISTGVIGIGDDLTGLSRKSYKKLRKWLNKN